MRRQRCMYSGDCEGKTPKSSRFTHMEIGDVNYCCIRDHCNQKEKNYNRIRKRLNFVGVEASKKKKFIYHNYLDITNPSHS